MATFEIIKDLASRLASEEEIAILDVRPREDYVAGHVLVATNAPIDEFDITLPILVPGNDTKLIILGDAADVDDAVTKAGSAGYTNVAGLPGYPADWLAAGWPVFEDINTLPKAFGEFVEHAYGTPSIGAAALKARLDRHEPVTVVDCRPAREYLAGHIPGAINLPGTDLLGVAAELRGDIVVHCGGRTRGIIAAQILRDAGLATPVSVLDNGTFGWELAGYDLETGPSTANPTASPTSLAWAERAADALAARFRLGWTRQDSLRQLRTAQPGRSVYLIDLRSEAAQRVAGAKVVSGGQLIQTVDGHVATQNAPVVLIADQAFAAIATASWLVRQGWRRVVLARPEDALAVFGAAGSEAQPAAPRLTPGDLAAWQDDAARARPLILDLSPSHHYVAGHLAEARGVRRTDLASVLRRFAASAAIVLTASDPRVAAAAWRDLPEHRRASAFVLDHALRDWREADLDIAIGPSGALSRGSWLNDRLAARWQGRERDLADFVDAELERFAALDGVPTLAAAKQGYLDWEIGLIDRIHADPLLRFRAG